MKTFTDPILANNPVTLQILGICSALAVTTSMTTAATMCVALAVVLMASSATISAIRRHIPNAIRLILQITIIAAMVIVADMILQAYAYEASKRLSIFVALIVTNCIVLGRAESFAMSNPVGPSILDALGNGLGYSAVLMTIAFVRELGGSGTLFGVRIYDGGLGFLLLAPSAFFLLGFLIWAIRTWQTAQIEPALTSVPEDA